MSAPHLAAPLLALALLSLGGCSEQSAVEAATQEDDHAHGSHNWTAFHDGIGLFVDFAPPVAGREARFLAHFTDLASGAPVA